MSYSRWSNSRWYTYWLSNDDEDRDHAVLAIMLVGEYFASQLRSDLAGCIDHAIKREENASKKPVTEDERQDLKQIMLMFLKDVDDQYPV